jgi:hypothetical protein
MKSSPLWCVVAWTVVLAPMIWGITHTVQSALKIFAAH